MPIMDSELLLCEAQSIAGVATTTTVSTNVIDTGALVDHKNASLQQSIMSGKMCWNCVVEDENMLAAVDGSVVTFRLFDDSDTTPTTGGRQILEFAVTENTPTEHPDGTKLFSIPLPAMPLSRYLGMSTNIATQDLSTGKVSAWIGPAI